MKKLKLTLSGKEMLTKEQMKRIHGGYCFTECSNGYYACCNDDPDEACKCHPNSEQHDCLSGGAGTIKCALG